MLRQPARMKLPRALPGSATARVRFPRTIPTSLQAEPLALRMDASGPLVVPLQDIHGQTHGLETIAPERAKRYLARGAKKGHFAVVGAEPGPLPKPAGLVLVCEGWATGASLHLATGCMVIAAMDAGNLMPAAEALRELPAAVADNDLEPSGAARLTET